MPVYLPLPVPALPSSASAPAPLADSQEEKRLEVLKHFSAHDYQLPGIAEKAELREREKFWLSNECILRYLRATKWDPSNAITRLEATLKWRREYGVDDLLTAEFVEPEAVTGKQVLFGYDVNWRPALYLLPSKQNTTEPTGQIQFTVWMLERAVDLMGPGVENLALLINFADKAKNPSMSTARTVLNILQTHYPERLGFSLIINVPFLIRTFFSLILPFVDPITRAKIKFNPDVVPEGIFTADMVTAHGWGGEVDFEYDHEQYWPTLVKMCKEKTEKELKCWTAMGGKVGLSEWEFKTSSLGVNLQDLPKQSEAEVGVMEKELENETVTPS